MKTVRKLCPQRFSQIANSTCGNSAVIWDGSFPWANWRRKKRILRSPEAAATAGILTAAYFMTVNIDNNYFTSLLL
jgi:hypothetical protein